ncbi:MAG: nucleotide exchange factor GrpE [Calditrichia bacterium]
MKNADITKPGPGTLIQTETVAEPRTAETRRARYKTPKKAYEQALLLQKENRILKDELKSFEKQITRRRREVADQARRELFLELLPVMDDLRVMLNHYNGKSEDQQLKEGAKLIFKNFENRLAGQLRLVEPAKKKVTSEASKPSAVVEEPTKERATQNAPRTTVIVEKPMNEKVPEMTKEASSPAVSNEPKATSGPVEAANDPVSVPTPTSTPTPTAARANPAPSADARRTRPVIPRLDDQNSAPLMRDSLVRPPIPDGKRAEVIIVPDKDDSSESLLRPDYDRYTDSSPGPLLKILVAVAVGSIVGAILWFVL